MRPSPLLNEIILGVFGRAQRYPLEIGGYVFASSHDYLLLRVASTSAGT